MNLVEKTHLFRELFINRDDVYPVQLANGQWIFKEEKLTDEIIKRHLEQRITIGCYSAANSTTKWLCIDIDSLESKDIEELQKRVDQLSMTVYYEFSGRKGYHAWFFFSKPVPNAKARILGNTLTSKFEVFPKQDFIPKDKVGNLVKAPLGIHQVSKKACVFVNNNLSEIPDQWNYLTYIKKIDIEAILQRLHIKTEAPLLDRTKYDGKNKTNRRTPSTFKPCVTEALINGVSAGKRNRVGHIIACECRRLKKPEMEARGVLTAWNLRNKPGLSASEINTVIWSAYRSQYEYGCKANGGLSQVLQCKGRGRCEYYRILLGEGEAVIREE